MWIDGSGFPASGVWPRCDVDSGRWVCTGVEVGTGGLVVFSPGQPARFVHVPSNDLEANGTPTAHTFAWANVMVIHAEGEPELVKARMRLWRPTASAVERASRLVPEAAVGCRSFRIALSTLVTGCSVAQDVEAELLAEGRGTVRVVLKHASASLYSPVDVLMPQDQPVAGVVETDERRPAPETQIDISELLEVTDPDGRARLVRRWVSAVETDSDGRFRVDGLHRRWYEALALNPRHGRATVRFRPGRPDLVIQLSPVPRATGRVWQRGVPVAGALVDLAPDLATFARRADPFDAVSPGTVTGTDGRFDVSLPPGGASDVRITFDDAILRRAIPQGLKGRVIDLGDLELPAPIVVDVEYHGPEYCTLIGVGPIGRSRVSLAEATVSGPGRRRLRLPEGGRWATAARCGTRDRHVRPASIDVPVGANTWKAYLTVEP